jgi:hypothetical protein
MPVIATTTAPRPAPNLLLIFSIRLVATLILLWLIRLVILRLPFLPPPPIPDGGWNATVNIAFAPQQATLASGPMDQALTAFAAQMKANGVEVEWQRQDRSDKSISYFVSARGEGLEKLNATFFDNRALVGLPLTITEIITSLVYLIVLIVLVVYAQALWSAWPQTFPRSASFTPVPPALVYVVALIVLHLALARPLLVLTESPDPVLLFQILLFGTAIILLGWMLVVTYRFLPAWLASLRLDMPSAPPLDVACPHCGQWSPAQMKFCGHCGKPLAQQPIIAVEATQSNVA